MENKQVSIDIVPTVRIQTYRVLRMNIGGEAEQVRFINTKCKHISAEPVWGMYQLGDHSLILSIQRAVGV